MIDEKFDYDNSIIRFALSMYICFYQKNINTMQKQVNNRSELIVHPLFIIGLVVLICNDCFFKWAYANAITGKLSDFAGLLIFPIFFAYLFPRCQRYICSLIGLLFIAWKLPMANEFIDLLNSVSIFQFGRVVDYTDLMALSILPFTHIFLNRHKIEDLISQNRLRVVRTFVLLISFFAFSATSMIRTEMPEGTIYIGKSYKCNISKDSLLSRFEDLGYSCRYVNDSLQNSKYYNYSGFYQIDTVLIKGWPEEYDTLKNIKFTLTELNENKTSVELINVELSKPGNIQNWRYLKQLSKRYKRQLKKEFLDVLD